MKIKPIKLFILILLICALVFAKGAKEANAQICEWTLTQVIAVLYEVIARGGSAREIGKVILEIQKYGSKCDSGGHAITGIPYPTPGSGTAYPTPPLGDGTWAFFCQVDPVIQDSSLSPSLAREGCGPTSMSMIYCTSGNYDFNSRFSCPWQPAATAHKVKSKRCLWNGSYVPCYGANGTYFTQEQGSSKTAVENILVNDMGLDVRIVPANLSKWQEFTSAGYKLLTYSLDTPCEEGCANPKAKLAHIFVVDSVDLTTGRVRLRDSINCGYSSGYKEKGTGRWLTASANPTGTLDSFKMNFAYAVRKR